MKYISILFLLVTPLTAKSQTFSGGSGTASDPYLIANAADLLTLSQLDSAAASMYWDKTYLLTADIDFGEDETKVDWNNDGTADWNSSDSLGFRPIGFFIYGTPPDDYFKVQFSGDFFGNGKSINGLYINRPNRKDVGLFGYLYYGSVNYLKLTSAQITGKENVGGIAGESDGSRIISCSVSGNISGHSTVGGLIGYCYYSLIDKCFSTGNVTGDYSIGGLTGLLYHAGLRCRHSYSSASVSGEEFVGGLVGQNLYAIILESYAVGDVTGDLDGDGLDGYRVGGLIGSHGPYKPAQAELINCYATGKVSTSHVDTAGGLVGWNDSSIISNSYFDKETTMLNNGVGLDGGFSEVFGKTTAEMKQEATFVDWDFEKIWMIDELVTYPKHRWETDASLSNVYIDGERFYTFHQDSLSYIFPVESGNIPVVTAFANSNDATVDITNITSVPGTATVYVTAGNGLTNRTYTIDFIEKISDIRNYYSDQPGEIAIYPNPVINGNLNISVSQPDIYTNCKISIQNANGQVIWSGFYSSMESRINVQTDMLSPGLYWIEISSNKEPLHIAKFIVL